MLVYVDTSGGGRNPAVVFGGAFDVEFARASRAL